MQSKHVIYNGMGHAKTGGLTATLSWSGPKVQSTHCREIHTARTVRLSLCSAIHLILLNFHLESNHTSSSSFHAI
jgi:hypothetical protein